MVSLAVSIVVIGGSRGVGRRIVEAAARNGARALAVARQAGPLEELYHEIPGVDILSHDRGRSSAREGV